jgi:hypothetical protein
MGWLALWLGVALAADPPSCTDVSWPKPSEVVSVAWVSPVGQTVGRHGAVTVVETAELRSFVAGEGRGSIGRMLQRIGLRKRSADPKKLYKIVIFDVRRDDLCRPVAGHDKPVALEGLVSCPERASKPSAGHSGCGYTIDRQTGETGVREYQADWSDLARNGFCVLPAARFVQQ